MSWVTPLGLPVVQPYRNEKKYVVKTMMQSVVLVDHSDALPVSLTRQRWDMLIALTLLYNGAIIPLSVSFSWVESPSSPYFWIDRLVDLVFLIDIFLNFVTGVITDDGVLSMERRVIVRTCERYSPEREGESGAGVDLGPAPHAPGLGTGRPCQGTPGGDPGAGTQARPGRGPENHPHRKVPAV